MHITLKFCGERPPETVEMLLNNLKDIRQAGPFDIKIEGIGGFPDMVKPRVIWAGVSGETDRLVAIRNEVERAAFKAAIPKENKKYAPHLTIGRRNSDLPVPENTLSLMERFELITQPWTVREITLMKSELSHAGPRYTPLGLFKI